jgi:hypothetical protein
MRKAFGRKRSRISMLEVEAVPQSIPLSPDSTVLHFEKSQQLYVESSPQTDTLFISDLF